MKGQAEFDFCHSWKIKKNDQYLYVVATFLSASIGVTGLFFIDRLCDHPTFKFSWSPVLRLGDSGIAQPSERVIVRAPRAKYSGQRSACDHES